LLHSRRAAAAPKIPLMIFGRTALIPSSERLFPAGSSQGFPLSGVGGIVRLAYGLFGALRLLAYSLLLMCCASWAQSSQQQPSKQRQGPIRIDPVYEDLATATGGQVLAINPTELGSTEAMGLFMSGSYTHDADVLAASDRVAGLPKSYRFPVDSTVRSLYVSISGEMETTLQRPDESVVYQGERGVEVAKLRQAALFTIAAPQPGPWTVTMKGSGPYSLLVKANTELRFDSFEFVEFRGRPGHEGYFPVGGFPLAGVDAHARAQLNGPFATAVFELRDVRNRPIERLALAAEPSDREEFFGSLKPPTTPFRVYVTGTDAAGLEYQRMQGQRISPQAFRVTATSAPEEVWQGEKASYTFKAHNFGEAASFQVTAVVPAGYPVRASPTRFSLGEDDEIQFRVETDVPFSATPGGNFQVVVVVDNGQGGNNSAIVETVIRK
jgi:hypothetical protein